MFNEFLNKLGLINNTDAVVLPKHLFIAGLISSVLTFICLMILVGYKTYVLEYTNKLFDPQTYIITLLSLTLFMLPIAFMYSMCVTFFNQFLVYILKVKSEALVWTIGTILGLTLSIIIFLLTKNIWLIPIFTMGSLWGLSASRFLSGKIEIKEKLLESK